MPEELLKAVLWLNTAVWAASLEAPPGMFRTLNDEILGDAIILNGKQLFIDDYIIETLTGAEKVLNQPAKHPKNPLIVPDETWEKEASYANGSVIYDNEDKLFKTWYHVWKRAEDGKTQQYGLCGYATSADGIEWGKPSINESERNNRVPVPETEGFCGQGVFKDPVETNPQRRYKMLYNEKPDGTAKSWSTGAAYSPDGIHWTVEPQNPLIPFTDTQSCPYWDARCGRYVATLRYGPPNVRSISRIESEDFVHWSPKITIFPQSEAQIDHPFNTKLYGMRIMPYNRVYIGLLTTYHGETIQPIPQDKEAWMDKVNVQLAFSRNGVTWMRVGRQGAIPHSELNQDRDWKTVAEQATFLPYGTHKKDWDWGAIYSFQSPLVVGDEIWVYYTGIASRHWGSYHEDAVPPTSGIGLATLRLDGFISIEAEDEGTLTTKPFLFIGDTLEVNANAAGGVILVDALDADGKVIEGFSKMDCTPITTDSVRHLLEWNGKTDCHLLQARPMKLRFSLKKAKLYAFAPGIRHKHYIPSYD